MALAIKSFYEFDEFRLDTEGKVLLKRGKPINLRPRVFQLLTTLVENHGRIVEKDDLMNQVWADTFVEESNLTFTVRQLRKTLGDDAHEPRFIETVPRRGYRFIADVRQVEAKDENSATDVEESIAELNDKHPAPAVLLHPINQNASQPSGVVVALADWRHEADENGSGESASDSSTEQTNAPTVKLQLVPSTSLVRNKRNNYLFVLAGLIFVVVLAGFVYWRLGKAVAEDKNAISSGKNSRIAYPNLNFERLSVSNTSHARLSSDGKYLAYATKTSGRESLWLRQIETNTNREIIPPDNVYYYGLAFSNDSQQLYFAKVKDKESGSIYRISILSGAATEIVKDEPQGQFAISPDDKQIVFIRHYIVEGNREYALIVADINGSNERKLFTRRGWLGSPDWSPDGQDIIFGGDDYIIRLRVSDGTNDILLKPSWYNIRRVKVLKDGSGLLIAAKEKATSNNQIYFFDYKSKEVSQVTNDTANYTAFSMTDDAKKIALTQTVDVSNVWITYYGNQEDAKQIATGYGRVTWMDENKIVFTPYINSNRSVWTMNSDGGDMKQLTFKNNSCMEPVVSSDRRFVVFVTDDFHIWRMDANGNNLIQLTDGSGEQFPSISPDGKWVFYNSIDRYNVWKVPIEGGNAMKITDETCIRPEVSPDEKMLACYQRNGMNRLQLVIHGIEDSKLIKTFDFVSDKLNFANLSWTPDSRAVDYTAVTIGVDNIWRQPLDGGKPRQMTNFKSEFIFGFGWSIDGKHLALTRGHWEDNIVLMTGFR